MAQTLAKRPRSRGRITAPVSILNDADAVAAGIAATRGQLKS